MNEIGRPRGHRCALRLAISTGHEAAVIANVQPLVSVGGPRIGPLDTADEEPVERRSGRPEPERSVDVVPGVGLLLKVIGDLCDGIEGTGVHVPCLAAGDDRALKARDERTECVAAHASLLVGRHPHDPLTPEAEVLEG